MIHYLAVVGSEAYGLAIDGSDLDILCVSDDGYKSNLCKRVHTIAYETNDFIEHFCPLPDKNLALYIKWLFPGEIMKETEFSKIAIANREQIIRSDLRHIYDEYLKKAENFSYQMNRFYGTFNKRPAYACMLYDTIYRYANGATFAEASKPSGDFQTWLISVRKGEIPMGEIIDRHQTLREQAISVEGFYDRERDDKFLAEVKKLFIESVI